MSKRLAPWSLSPALFLTALLMALPAMATPQLPDPPDGAGLYFACAACHGETGEGNADLAAPRLSGQHANYLVEQMINFQTGARGGHADDYDGAIMRQMSLGLSLAELDAIAAYVSALSVPQSQSPPAKDETSDGAMIYADNCASCHGQFGEGSVSVYAPNLSILSPWYMRSQMAAYAKGWRGSEETGTTRAKNMRAIATQITTQEDLDAVISFLQSPETE